MESDNAVVGAIIFIVMILGANFVMYAIARGAIRPNNRSFLEHLGKSLSQPMQKKDDSLDELHRRIQALDEAGKDPPQNPE